MKKYIICGKFRIFHKAHQELILRVLSKCQELNIVAYHDDSDRLEKHEVYEMLGRLTQKFDVKTNIYVVDRKEYDSIESYEEELITIVGGDYKDYIVVNSKENYNNINFKNEFIPLIGYENYSATEIEKDIIGNINKISQYCRPYLNHLVVITGIESCGKTTIAKKLADHFDCWYSEEYGKWFSKNNRGGQDKALVAEDFATIAINQLKQNEEMNRYSRGITIIDTDPIVTLYYYDMYVHLGLIKPNTHIHSLLNNVCATYAKSLRNKSVTYISLSPTVPFVQDGTRYFSNLDERKELNEGLETLYTYKDIKNIKTIYSSDYEKRYLDCLDIINNDLRGTHNEK